MNHEKEKNISKYIKSFAASRYRKKIGDEAIVSTILPIFSINLDDITQVINQSGKAKVMIEIGSGCGDFIVNYAKNNLDTLCIGAEVYQGGLINTIKKLQKEKVDNIRLFYGDGRTLIDGIPNDILDEIYVLFPDPWPKQKHKVRRIINNEYMPIILQKLKNTGIFVSATDIEDYQDQMRKILGSIQNYNIKEINEEVLPKSNLCYTITKYHHKASLAGRKSIFFKLTKQ